MASTISDASDLLPATALLQRVMAVLTNDWRHPLDKFRFGTAPHDAAEGGSCAVSDENVHSIKCVLGENTRRSGQ
jgi:hypothetical protein